MVNEHEKHTHHCYPDGPNDCLATILEHDLAIVPEEIHHEKITPLIMLLLHFKFIVKIKLIIIRQCLLVCSLLKWL